MMHEFLTANRDELIARCRAKVALRSPPGLPEDELANGVTVFLGQLIKTLKLEETAHPMRSRQVSGPSGGGNPTLSEIGESATLHGKELMQHGFTVEEAVHDYGDLCQSISDLAVETGAPFGVDEFRTLNRCLDNAIASAVTEFGYQRDFGVADQQTIALNERLGMFAHELRNQLCTATLALSIIKAGNVGLSGATGGVLDRALVGLSNLIDRSLAEVRMTAGMQVMRGIVSLAGFVSEIKLSASLEAQVKDCVFTVGPVDPLLAIDVDRDLLLAAVGNLLQNAFKFSHRHTEVTLNAYAVADRILIDVEDRCGGLPSGDAERCFFPSRKAAMTRAAWGWACLSHGAAWRPMKASSACAMFPASVAYSLSICHAIWCRKIRLWQPHNHTGPLYKGWPVRPGLWAHPYRVTCRSRGLRLRLVGTRSCTNCRSPSSWSHAFQLIHPCRRSISDRPGPRPQ